MAASRLLGMFALMRMDYRRYVSAVRVSDHLPVLLMLIGAFFS